MTKFGEIISIEKPVLIDFYSSFNNTTSNLGTIRTVASSLKDRAKVVKIDITKNPMLAQALSVEESPTFIIYKNGEMKWRDTGEQTPNVLINLVEAYI